jgi:hypothetical protein
LKELNSQHHENPQILLQKLSCQILKFFRQNATEAMECTFLTPITANLHAIDGDGVSTSSQEHEYMLAALKYL